MVIPGYTNGEIIRRKGERGDRRYINSSLPYGLCIRETQHQTTVVKLPAQPPETLKMRPIALAALAGTALAHLAPRQNTTDCTREFLQDAVATYIAAQTAGDPSAFTHLTSAATYTENFVSSDAAAGILASPLVIDHNRSLYDTTQCATYTELIVTDASHPYVIGTQLWFSGAEVELIETLVTDEGDWLFNAADTLQYAEGEDWFEIPEADRDTREVIQAGGDAYLDIFNDKTVEVP